MVRNLVGACLFLLGGYLAQQSGGAPANGRAAEPAISLGNFSVSLAVKDLAKSREFYEKLGFHVRSGDQKKWVVLQNDSATLGLFQGLFEKNSLTFNPGWDRSRNPLPTFDDVRELQKKLAGRGLEFKTRADEASTGPASFSLADPDGNPVLVDQFVAAPKK